MPLFVFSYIESVNCCTLLVSCLHYLITLQQTSLLLTFKLHAAFVTVFHCVLGSCLWLVWW